MAALKTGNKFDRYLMIVRWAQRRYRGADGTLIISAGGTPSRYSIVENIAAVHVLGLNPKYGPQGAAKAVH